MIKINLLPQRRAKRAGAQPGLDGGNSAIAIGLASLAGVALVVFFAVDQPKRSRLRDLNEINDSSQTEIKRKNGAARRATPSSRKPPTRRRPVRSRSTG